MTSEAVRLQAFLARAGVASRRASEELIRQGRVQVNGARAEIGVSVRADVDVVEVDGRVVRPQVTEWIALHKPRGYVTTREDPRARRTVYDLLPDQMRHLFHVGRLDRESSGLLLFTNDGETANRLLHPRYETTKEYLVDVAREPTDDELRKLTRGIRLEDGPARMESVQYTGQPRPDRFRLRVVMKEGRNREVRRLMDAVGHTVVRLFRRRFGPVEVGKLRPGEWRALTADEVQSLRGPAGPRRGR